MRCGFCSCSAASSSSPSSSSSSSSSSSFSCFAVSVDLPPSVSFLAAPLPLEAAPDTSVPVLAPSAPTAPTAPLAPSTSSRRLCLLTMVSGCLAGRRTIRKEGVSDGKEMQAC